MRALLIWEPPRHGSRLCYGPALDVTALAFYAAVCGLLSLAGPRLGAPLTRMAIGALVGIAAAALLPAIRAQIGL